MRADRPTATPGRIVAALALGFCGSVACVAATAPNDARSAEVHPLTAPAASSQEGAADPLAADGGTHDSGTHDGGDNKYPGCPHGALEDPHRGFVRCLGPGEKSPFSPTNDPKPPPAPDGGTGNDAGPPGADGGSSSPDGGTGNDAGPPNNSPPAGTQAPPGAPPPAPPGSDGAKDAGAPPDPPKPGPPPTVEMKAPKFENGDVPKAEKNLSGKKVLEGIAKCVSEGGGVTGKGGAGSLKVSFLVRAQGKAEGVEVEPTGVPAEAAKCVRALIKNRSVGTPTADPVGVTVVYSLKSTGK